MDFNNVNSLRMTEQEDISSSHFTIEEIWIARKLCHAGRSFFIFAKHFIKQVFCLGPRSCSVKTRLNCNIYINPIKSAQYDGEIAESLLLDV